jgi:transposase-like protein
MTAREKFYVIDLKNNLVEKSNYCCEICGKTVNENNAQLAHRIPKTLYNIKKYGMKYIHHPLNLKVVCSLYCNSKVNIGNNIYLEKQIIAEIKELFND